MKIVVASALGRKKGRNTYLTSLHQPAEEGALPEVRMCYGEFFAAELSEKKASILLPEVQKVHPTAKVVE